MSNDTTNKFVYTFSGFIAGGLSMLLICAVTLEFVWNPEPVIKGYDEPSEMYQAPDGLWYPEPTLAN